MFSKTLRRKSKKEDALLDHQKDLKALQEETTPSKKSERHEKPLVVDIISFKFEGENAVLIDTNQDGNFGDETILRTYKLHQDKASFGGPIGLSFAVNIFNDGKKVSLLYDGGTHGTHVAGIAAAYHGVDHPLNGMAPGAQIIAIRCGHPYMKNGAVNASILRAFHYAINAGADLINLSYGGSQNLIGGGYVRRQSLNEILRDSNVPAFVAVGNEGPALSTVGLPGSGRNVFGIAATNTVETRESNYGALPMEDEDDLEQLFSFSSRGPTLNGNPGVDFAAPGAAFSTVPTYKGVHSVMMQGTSMASPAAAGTGAVILSAIKNRGWDYSLARLERALINGARPLPAATRVEVGHGLIHVPGTLTAYEESLPFPVSSWIIQADNKSGKGNGLYDRETDFKKEKSFSVIVQPDLAKNLDKEERARFECRLQFTSDQDWLRVQKETSISALGHNIGIYVDPLKMKQGLNIGTVTGRRISQNADGTTNVIPGKEIVIPAFFIRPEESSPDTFDFTKNFALKAGESSHLFIKAPLGATHALFHFEDEAESAVRYKAEARSLTNVSFLYKQNAKSALVLKKGDKKHMLVAVQAGHTIDLALQKSFYSSYDSLLKVHVEFLGLSMERLESGPGDREQVFALACTLRETPVRFKAKMVGGAHITSTPEEEITIHPTQPSLYDNEFLYQKVYKFNSYLTPGKWSTKLSTLLFEGANALSAHTRVYDQNHILLAENRGRQVPFTLKKAGQVFVEITEMQLGKKNDGEKTQGIFETKIEKPAPLFLEPGTTSSKPLPLEKHLFSPGMTRIISCRLPSKSVSLYHGLEVTVALDEEEGGAILYKDLNYLNAGQVSPPSFPQKKKLLKGEAFRIVQDSFFTPQPALKPALSYLQSLKDKDSALKLLLIEHTLRPEAPYDLAAMADRIEKFKKTLSVEKKKDQPLLAELLACEARIRLHPEKLNLKEAEDSLKKAAGLGAQGPLFLMTQRDFYKVKGNFSKEKEILRTLYKTFPHHWPFVNDLAVLEARFGEVAEAQSLLLKEWEYDERKKDSLFKGMQEIRRLEILKTDLLKDLQALKAGKTAYAWSDQLIPLWASFYKL